MRNPRHKPFWLRAEGDEWQGLWEKGTLKKWNRSDLLGCLSYLVNMTRPDLAFSFSQLSKFLQCPGDAHLAAAYRVFAYVMGTLNQGLSYHDPGVEKRNALSGWVDSDFASDIDTRKSVTSYLMVLNGGPVSWKASRQGGGYVEQ
jgi:hypothetical protein